MNRFLILLSLVIFTSIASGQNFLKWIQSGDLESIQKYEQKGGNIHATFSVPYILDDQYYEAEWHALTYAAGRNQYDIVVYYLDKKAEMEKMDPGLWDRALEMAFIASLPTKNDTLINLLYRQRPDLTALCEPCHSQNAIMVAATYGLDYWYFKLKPQSDLTIVNVNGSSILHAAIEGGSDAIVHDVVASGLIDINKSDGFSHTPLDLAALDSNEVLFNYLISQGADIDASVDLWFSVAQSGNMEIFHMIAETYKPAWLFNQNDEGELPLHYAVGLNQTAMTARMVELMKNYIAGNGTDILDDFTFIDNNGVHVLQYATGWENPVTYELIFDLTHFFNASMEDQFFIEFPNFVAKQATRTFGRDFAEQVNDKHQVNFY
jgi:ankyrin repeat protein